MEKKHFQGAQLSHTPTEESTHPTLFMISSPELDVKLSFLALATVFKAASVTLYIKSDLQVELMLKILSMQGTRAWVVYESYTSPNRNQTLFLISILLPATAVVPQNTRCFVVLFQFSQHFRFVHFGFLLLESKPSAGIQCACPWLSRSWVKIISQTAHSHNY